MSKLIFVHFYKWSHMNRRKQLRKALKNGLIEFVEKNDDGILYKIPDDFKVRKG